MRRRAALAVIFLAWSGTALDRSDVLDAIEPLASALSENDAVSFLNRISKQAPHRDSLVSNVRSLLESAEITCSVDVVKVLADGAELDWYMELRDKATQTVVERRRGSVRFRFHKRDILEIEPVSFFAPHSE